jgi:hypothetical protein
VALFSVVDAVILSPLPIPNEDRVHLLWKTDPANQPHLVGELAYPELADLQREMRSNLYTALFSTFVGQLLDLEDLVPVVVPDASGPHE